MKNNRHTALGTLIATALLLLAFASPASAAQQWRLESAANTTVSPVDDPLESTSTLKENELPFFIQATNAGEVAMDGSQIELRVDLPPGLSVKSAKLMVSGSELVSCFDAKDGSSPVAGASGVICRTSIAIATEAGGVENWMVLFLTATADSTATGTLLTEIEVSGGGAPSASITDGTLVSEEPPPFGIDAFDVHVADESGGEFSQAAGHPGSHTTHIDFNTQTSPKPSEGSLWPVEEAKSALAELPAGFIGNPTVADTCTAEQLVGTGGLNSITFCPPTSQVGTTMVRLKQEMIEALGVGLEALSNGPVQIFNMVPPSGVPARFGFNVLGTIVTLDAHLRSDGDYGLTVGSANIPPTLPVAGSDITFWGVPASEEHRRLRACPEELPPWRAGPTCASGVPERPFFRMPTSCTDPGEGIETTMRIASWAQPSVFSSKTIASHDAPGYPWPEQIEGIRQWGEEIGVTGCEDVPVKAKLSATPTSIDTETPSGLQVHVEVPNPGMENPEGIASSDIKKVRVSLPQGVTINPSQAEGLNVCSPSQYASTELSFFPTPGKGCPEDSKVGSVEVVTPLLEETLKGDVYVAEQGNNPFGSLLAIYVVIKNPERGILVKLPGLVETDEKSGRILTTFDDLPQLPFDSFDFRFREGARAPLVTPPHCGKYETTSEFWGHSDPDGPPLVSTSSFEIVRGIGGASCPPGGIPPFEPGFSAGTINNSAGAFSPTTMRLTRSDGEQDLTKFSATLPEGLLAKLAGVEKCSDAALASAKAKTGRQELASPSCPASSKIGRTLAGAGVGSVLTYVPGSIYLAGPYKGAPLSVAAITPAVAGPFDVGTVVVRVALSLNPITGAASVDGAASDPIPHILKGIPLKLRDLRVYVDRDNFTLNPTSCDPSEVKATLFGSYADVFNPADDKPVDLASRFQAANCASLGFKPKLSIKLKGGTKRGDFPGLVAVLRPRKGDANLARTVVKLPKSAFLEQGHIRTICTRVQWAADACPKAAVYGRVTAFSPLLDDPLKGNAYLRSSNNKLPDLVFDLKGIVEIEAAARIDSVGGGIRAQVQNIPDAPISKVVLRMQGGKKGLIVNSRNLCFEPSRNRANLTFGGQNGKRSEARPVLGATGCGKGRRR